jgi:phosphatidylglycerophosphate synthase
MRYVDRARGTWASYLHAQGIRCCPALSLSLWRLQGAGKKQVRDPRSYVGRSAAGKATTHQQFVWYFFMAFFFAPRRDTPKKSINKNREKIGIVLHCISVDFFFLTSFAMSFLAFF